MSVRAILLVFILAVIALPASAVRCFEDLGALPFWTRVLNDDRGDPFLAISESFVGEVRQAHMGSVATGESCAASPCPPPFPVLGDGYDTGEVWVHRHSGAATWPLTLDQTDPFALSASSSMPFIYSPEPGDFLYNTVGYDNWTHGGSFYYGGFAALFENSETLVDVTLDRMHDTEPGEIRVTTLHPDQTSSEWTAPASTLPHMAPYTVRLEDVEGFTVDSKLDRARFSVRNVCAHWDTDGDGFENECDGDFNNDGAVGGPDHAIFLADYATGIDSGVGTDMNEDGSVGGPDFGLFLAVYGGAPCP